jgi:hypothetical protein
LFVRLIPIVLSVRLRMTLLIHCLSVSYPFIVCTSSNDGF